MKVVFYCSLICVCCLGLQAQQPKTAVWLGGQLQLKFSNKLAWHNDAGFRTLGTDFLLHQYLYRTGVRHFVNENISVAVGGAIFFTRSSFDKNNHDFGSEFRLWQEVMHQTNINKLAWQNRVTVEQRFFDDTKYMQGFTAQRFRIKTIFTNPVSKKWAVQLSDEYLRQYARHIFAFDQNRVMLYGLYSSNASTVWKGGYMLLILPAKQTRHVFNINFQKTLQLRHNENKI